MHAHWRHRDKIGGSTPVKVQGKKVETKGPAGTPYVLCWRPGREGVMPVTVENTREPAADGGES